MKKNNARRANNVTGMAALFIMIVIKCVALCDIQCVDGIVK